jgi:hypothetical protein
MVNKSICIVTLRYSKNWKIGLVEDGRVVSGAGRCRCFFAFAFDWPDEGSLIVVDYDLI